MILGKKSSYSICRIDCNACKFKVEQNCKGCKTIKGKVFWGECELYNCNAEKEQDHCGKCKQFPCDKLKQSAKHKKLSLLCMQQAFFLPLIFRDIKKVIMY